MTTLWAEAAVDEGAESGRWPSSGLHGLEKPQKVRSRVETGARLYNRRFAALVLYAISAAWAGPQACGISEDGEIRP